MASHHGGPSSEVADEDRTKDAASCHSQLLGDADGNESCSNPGSSAADDSDSESGVADAEQPVNTDPSGKRVQCVPVPYGEEDADSDAESESTEHDEDEDAVMPYGPPGVVHDEDLESSGESAGDEELSDDEEDADVVFDIQVIAPLRPPGQ